MTIEQYPMYAFWVYETAQFYYLDKKFSERVKIVKLYLEEKFDFKQSKKMPKGLTKLIKAYLKMCIIRANPNYQRKDRKYIDWFIQSKEYYKY